MGFRNWLANRVMRFLSQNANDSEDAQVDMKGQSISIKELKKIQSEWERDGLIR